MYDVYLITNSVNGKKYVGVTSRGYLFRFNEHIKASRNCPKTMLHHAIRKHGEKNFTIKLLESNVSDLCVWDREQYYIKFYNTFFKNRRGYNMTLGGGGALGYHHTDEAKEKIKKSSTGRKYSEERNNKIRIAMRGRYYKPEWRIALSKSRIGKYTKDKNPFYGKHHTDTTKQVIGSKNSRYTVFRCDVDDFSIIESYDSAMSAARWVVDSGLSTNISACNTRILYVCKDATHRSAYGFRWRFEKKCID
jgi:group I intron endonuclease